MKLYLLEQHVTNGYATFDAIVVAAEDEESARQIHPYDRVAWDAKHYFVWAKTSDQVEVTYLGEAKEGTLEGVILASYNAS